jgi:LysM repeat protein
MQRRTPARWLAPIALAGAVVAVLIVASSDKGSHSGSSTITSSSTTSTRIKPGSSSSSSSSSKHHGRFHLVKAGETLSAIAAKTGVPLSQIVALNPHVDAQSLTLGQKIKLDP